MGERESAISAADRTCPRCGAAREPEQAYCLECGLALPPVEGRLPSLRPRWIRRIGWYPGDWVWISLLTFLIAAGGAAAAIALTDRVNDEGSVFVATTNVPVTEPTTPVAPGTTTRRQTGDTSTLPTPPEPRTTTG